MDAVCTATQWRTQWASLIRTAPDSTESALRLHYTALKLHALSFAAILTD